jgi:hypothetical protein
MQNTKNQTGHLPYILQAHGTVLGLCHSDNMQNTMNQTGHFPYILQAHGTVLGLCRSGNMQNTKTLIKMNKNLCLTTSTDKHLCVITIISMVHSAAVSVSGTSNNILTLASLTAKVNVPCAACHESFCMGVVTAPHIANYCDHEDRLNLSATSPPAATHYP